MMHKWYIYINRISPVTKYLIKVNIGGTKTTSMVVTLVYVLLTLNRYFVTVRSEKSEKQ